MPDRPSYDDGLGYPNSPDATGRTRFPVCERWACRRAKEGLDESIASAAPMAWAPSVLAVLHEIRDAANGRFKSRDAYVRHHGTAPYRCGHRTSPDTDSAAPAPASSTPPYTGSRSPQARWHPPAKAFIDRRRSSGKSGRKALRILKRCLSDVVFEAPRTVKPSTSLAA